MEGDTMNTQAPDSSKKSKKGLIIGIIIVVLLVGWFMSSKGSSPLGGSDAVGSLSELMSRGKPAKCEYSMAGEGFDQKSTVYYDGAKIYMENVSVVAGKEVKSHIIIGDDFQYMWSDDATNQGIKMPVVKPTTEPSQNVPTGQASQVDFGKSLQMNCSGWSGDDSLFTPPAGVTFTDLSDLGKSFGGPSGSMCGTCATLTGDDKTQCEAMFCQ